MKLLTAVYLFSSANILLVKSKTDDVEKDVKNSRIIGGQNCQVEDHPHVVSLRKTAGLVHMCGGSVIGKTWILTAGHCVFRYIDDPEYLTVVAGLSAFWDDSIQLSTVKKIHLHDQYDPYKLIYNDIAVLRLKKPLHFSSSVLPVQLPSSKESYERKVCKIGVVMGWGLPTESNRVKIITNELCRFILPISVPKTIMCAMYEPGGKDACFGDSGGPLMCGKTLVGLVSAGFNCGLPRKPSLYTRVDQFITFIDEITIVSSTPKMTACNNILLGEISLIYFHFKNN